MQETWPEPVERVAVFLRGAGAEARLEQLESGTATAEDAARAAGCPLGQIVKSILVMCDGRPVLVLVPGDRRADLGKIGAAVGAAQTRIARAAEVEASTGFAPGSVAPFPLPGVEKNPDRPHPAHPRAGLDRRRLASHLAALPPAELVRLARAVPMDAVQDPAYDSGSKGDA